MGKPGFPIPQPRLGAAGAPQAGVWGNPVSPYVHLRLRARGAQRRDEHGVSLGGLPPPWPSPAGGGNRAPPLREGVGETGFPYVPTSVGSGWRPHRQGYGETRFPHIFTSVLATNKAGVVVLIRRNKAPARLFQSIFIIVVLTEITRLREDYNEKYQFLVTNR